MPQVISQVQIKRSDKTLDNLSTTKLKYGEPILLVNPANKALVIGNSSEADTIANDYFIPLETKDTLDKGYMVKGVDYVTAGQKSGETLGTKATAEGNNTAARGDASHAEGTNTTASHKSQHVFGEYNVVDNSSAASTSRGNYVEIVGNGTAANALSNARTLDWSGNEKLAGKLTLGAGPTNNLDAATKKYVDDAIPAGAVTSVRVQATSPVVSSQNTAQSSTLNTTISLADGYGDTKNPYASKAKNLVLATPSAAAGVPSFRALASADLPSHNHSAADITSGTLAVNRGGTGKSSWTANGVAFADTTSSLSQISAPSAEAFLMQKNTGAPYYTLKTTIFSNTALTGNPTAPTPADNDNDTSIATTAYVMREANKKQVAKITRTATLTVAGWSTSNNTQSVSVSGVTTSNLVEVSPAPASWKDAGNFGIYCSAQAANSLTFTCSNIPNVAITINVVIWN